LGEELDFGGALGSIVGQMGDRSATGNAATPMPSQ
jgi:hypothetical protein